MKKIFLIVFLFIAPGLLLCAEDFRFIQITDFHWGPQEHIRRLEAAVAMIRKLPWKIDFIAVTGDLTMENILEPGVTAGIKKTIGKAGLPVHWLPGNHDILPYGTVKRRDETRRIWEKHFSPLAYAVDHKGVRLVFSFLETVREGYTLPGYDGWGWLEQTLRKAGTMPVFLFHHAPPVRDFYFAGMNPQDKDPWGEANRTRYRTVINRHDNVKGIFCGHFHRDDLHWIGSVPLFSAPSIAGYWGRQASFRVYHWQDGRLGYITVYVQ